jgi:hypothetical protein
MGIYGDGAVYGVSLAIGSRSIVERKYDQQMNGPQIQEIKTLYDALSTEDKQNMSVRFYTSAVTTYEHESMSSFMTWFPGTRSTLGMLFRST